MLEREVVEVDARLWSDFPQAPLTDLVFVAVGRTQE
jgi:hypothetical protein